MSRGSACDEARRRRWLRAWRASRSAMSTKEYPHKLDHVLHERRRCAAAARAPPDLLRQLRLAQLRPRLVDAADAAAAVPAYRRSGGDRASWRTSSFTPRKGRAPNSPISTGRSAAASSGRMAGPGCSTCTLKPRGTSDGWGAELEPLARAFAERLRDYLEFSPIRSASAPISTPPSRSSCRSNGRTRSIRALAEQIRDRARHWFGADRDCQAWEPGGDEFLSPALIEALCMARDRTGAVPALVRRTSCRALPRASRQRCSRLRSSATAATGRSRISTASTSAAPGAGASIAPLLPPTRARRRRRRRRRASCGGAAAHLRRLYGRALARELRLARVAGVRDATMADTQALNR